MFARETQVRKDSKLFVKMCTALLDQDFAVKFKVEGRSMSPNLEDGDDVLVKRPAKGELCPGEIAFAESEDGLRVHRVSSVDDASGGVVLRSDTGSESDRTTRRVFGKVIAIERGARHEILGPFETRWVHPTRSIVRRFRVALKNRARRVLRKFTASAVVSAIRKPTK